MQFFTTRLPGDVAILSVGFVVMTLIHCRGNSERAGSVIALARR